MKYKELYLKEKRRRELYEKYNPELKDRWEKMQLNLKDLAIDLEKAFLFGTLRFK